MSKRKKIGTLPNGAPWVTECPEGYVYIVLVGSPALVPEYAKIMGVYPNRKLAEYRQGEPFDWGRWTVNEYSMRQMVREQIEEIRAPIK